VRHQTEKVQIAERFNTVQDPLLARNRFRALQDSAVRAESIFIDSPHRARMYRKDDRHIMGHLNQGLQNALKRLRMIDIAGSM
jgi:hypothetical protein